MPGVNLTGKPQTSDLVLGRGSLNFALLDATTKKPLGFRHLGNCTNFALTMETEVLEHFSSRTGIRSIDREIILTQKCGVSITLDENSYQNLALWLSGAATAAVTNPARTTVTNQLISSSAFKGFTYQLVNSSGDRLMDTATGTLVVKAGPTTGQENTLTLGTDYEHDSKWGLIFLIPGGGVTDTWKVTYTYTTASNEKAIDTVDILTQTKISGFLRFIMINAANSDKQEILDLHSVTLKADGEMQRIGDEFASMTFTGSAERNEVGYPTSPVGKLYFHADA
jgi:hypothetical protein